MSVVPTPLALNSALQLAESQIHIPRTPVSLAEWKLNCSFGLNSLSLMVCVIWNWQGFELGMLFIPCPEL